MSTEDAHPQTRCIARLAAALSQEPRLRAELLRARRQFFGDAGEVADAVAEHRFAEWFLLERECDALGAVPATIEPYAAAAEELGDSIAGLFLVESTGETVTLRDVQAGEVLELDAAGSLQPGDLLVGRLYPVTGERWTPSAATPALRPGRELARAFARDLEQLGLERRLQQIELEHLLLQKHDGERVAAGAAADALVPGPPPMPLVPLEHLEADLEKLLGERVGVFSATAISEQLAQVARPGAVIGPLLDQLAFDTDVDLDRARQLLLEIWNAHHSGSGASAGGGPAVADSAGGPPGETLGERLVRTLDQGLGEQRDTEELFHELERMAGVDSAGDDAADDDDDSRSAAALVDEVAGGDAGDLGPLVTEFHWELGREDGDASALTLWVELQQNAPVPNTDFESVAAHDVMRLLLHVYLRSAPRGRAGAVRQAFAELERFYEWCREAQEMDRCEVLAACRGALLEQLDRLEQASLQLGDDRAPSSTPILLQIEELGADGFGARDDDGAGHWIAASAEALAQLAVGDLVLGALDAASGAGGTPTRRFEGLVVVLPIDARSLIE